MAGPVFVQVRLDEVDREGALSLFSSSRSAWAVQRKYERAVTRQEAQVAPKVRYEVGGVSIDMFIYSNAISTLCLIAEVRQFFYLRANSTNPLQLHFLIPKPGWNVFTLLCSVCVTHSVVNRHVLFCET